MSAQIAISISKLLPFLKARRPLVVNAPSMVVLLGSEKKGGSDKFALHLYLHSYFDTMLSPSTRSKNIVERMASSTKLIDRTGPKFRMYYHLI